MSFRYFRALLLFVATSCSITAYARDCVLVPKVSLCGVPLNAAQEVFEREFGAPDGRIAMGTDRVGLLYGTNFIVIYWHKKLWSVENWKGAGGWMGYVGFGRKDRETTLRFHNWNPWNSLSPDARKRPKEIQFLDGDEGTDGFAFPGGGGSISYYIMSNEVRHERWSVTGLSIVFDK